MTKFLAGFPILFLALVWGIDEGSAGPLGGFSAGGGGGSVGFGSGHGSPVGVTNPNGSFGAPGSVSSARALGPRSPYDPPGAYHPTAAVNPRGSYDPRTAVNPRGSASNPAAPGTTGPGLPGRGPVDSAETFDWGGRYDSR